jgi:hypothetical protein
MARKHHKVAAARAQAARAQNTTRPNINDDAGLPPSTLSLTDSTSDIECTSWTGGVNHVFSDSEDEDPSWTDTDTGTESENSDFDDLEELEGEELIKSLQMKCQHELDLELDLKQLATPTPYESLLQTKTPKDWKIVESRRALGYNGRSNRRKREVAQEIREKDARDKVIRNR